MIIACDVDCTLYPAEPLFAKLSREAGIDYPEDASYWLTYKDIKKFDGSAVTQQEMKSVFRKAHSTDYISQQVPYENASSVLNIMREKYDVDIYFVSDRHAQMNGPLRQWLVDHGFMHFAQDCVVTTKDKRHWLKQHKPEIVIDDRARTICFSRFELGSQVFAIEHNHNINLKNEIEGIHICKDWNAINDCLLKYLKDTEKYFN